MGATICISGPGQGVADSLARPMTRRRNNQSLSHFLFRPAWPQHKKPGGDRETPGRPLPVGITRLPTPIPPRSPRTIPSATGDSSNSVATAASGDLLGRRVGRADRFPQGQCGCQQERGGAGTSFHSRLLSGKSSGPVAQQPLTQARQRRLRQRDGTQPPRRLRAVAHPAPRPVTPRRHQRKPLGISALGPGMGLYSPRLGLDGRGGSSAGRSGSSRVADHVRLAEALRGAPFFWVLSYDDHPRIRELYSWASIDSFEMKPTIATVSEKGRRKNREILIRPLIEELDAQTARPVHAGDQAVADQPPGRQPGDRRLRPVGERRKREEEDEARHGRRTASSVAIAPPSDSRREPPRPRAPSAPRPASGTPPRRRRSGRPPTAGPPTYRIPDSRRAAPPAPAPPASARRPAPGWTGCRRCRVRTAPRRAGSPSPAAPCRSPLSAPRRGRAAPAVARTTPGRRSRGDRIAFSRAKSTSSTPT
jgi:hypothetical protein